MHRSEMGEHQRIAGKNYGNIEMTTQKWREKQECWWTTVNAYPFYNRV